MSSQKVRNRKEERDCGSCMSKFKTQQCKQCVYDSRITRFTLHLAFYVPWGGVWAFKALGSLGANGLLGGCNLCGMGWNASL